MKPQNVVENTHYFAFAEDEMNGEGTRFDACKTRDDGSGVWSPQSGRWYPQPSYEKAKIVAFLMSELYAELHPK